MKKDDPFAFAEAGSKAKTPNYLGSSKAVKTLLSDTAQEFLDGIQDGGDPPMVAEPLAKHLAIVLLGMDPDYPGIPNWNEPDGGIVRWVASNVGAEETDPELVLEHLAIGLFSEAGKVAAYAAEEGVTPEQWQWQYEDVLDRYTRLAMGIPEPAEDE